MDSELIAKAKLAVEELSGEFEEMLSVEINKLETLANQVSLDSEDVSADLKKVFIVSHDLKGQAGTFDFHLITHIGHSLCKLIEKLKQVDEKDLELVRAHVDSMKYIISEQIKGDGGPVEEKLIDNLEDGVERTLEKYKQA